MTVVLRHNEALELNLIEYSGALTAAQLKGLAAFAARHPDMLRHDNLNIIRADADFSAIAPASLDALFARYRALYAQMQFPIYRRAAWLCFAPAAEGHLAYWLDERDLREAFAAHVRRFNNLADAAEWLLLNNTEAACVESGEGFAEIAVFGPALAPAMAR